MRVVAKLSVRFVRARIAPVRALTIVRKASVVAPVEHDRLVGRDRRAAEPERAEADALEVTEAADAEVRPPLATFCALTFISVVFSPRLPAACTNAWAGDSLMPPVECSVPTEVELTKPIFQR